MADRSRRAAFLFRRDLRLDDNVGLRRAAERADEVVAAFVFDPRQGSASNRYFGAPAFQFLLESLADLDGQLARVGGRLHRFAGLPHEVVVRLAGEAGIEAVFVNADSTPFARERDRELAAACAAHGIAFEAAHDLLLTEPGSVRTGAGGPYQVFTPFWRAASQVPVPAPQPLGPVRFCSDLIPSAVPPELGDDLLGAPRRELFARGGREAGLAALDRIARLGDYETTRDLPALDGTSGLSPHHKFGTVSIRETFHAVTAALGAGSAVLRELYWRDFFTHLAWHFPHVFGRAFRPEYDAVEWDDDPELLAAWTEGRTGFPLVDAGMRQLAGTGWMHNRVRMVVASFLTKDLHLHWREGERVFAQRLVDYDPAVNNGNWQWAASTGADAQPWFRIFNPWTQQQKFDPEARYIRRHVPELAHLSPAEIHALPTRRPIGLAYPHPVVDHRVESIEAKRRFERALGRS